MNLPPFPFSTTDWQSLPLEEHAGITGTAIWRVQHFGPLRVRWVEYSPGYLADHWCSKGHIIFCVKGEMITELQDGRQFKLTGGMSYQVGDNIDTHRSRTKTGVTLFIVD